MTFSVVIPVYNTQRYLRRCVESVRAQCYEDIEIILVDDGSQDGSGQLCDELAREDVRIQVIHKQNGGLSDARNHGLQAAKGEYVLFLDSDDVWLLEDGLEKISQRLNANKTDLLLFKRVDLYSSLQDTLSINDCRQALSPDYDEQFISSHTAEQIFYHLVCSQRFDMSACFLAVSRELLIKNDLFFPVGLLSEDVDWSLRLWLKVQSVQALNIGMYGYWHRAGSITTTYSIRNLRSYNTMFTLWTDRMPSLHGLYKSSVGGYLAGLYVSCLYQYGQLSKNERCEARDILRQHEDLLRYAINKKGKRAAIVYKYGGFFVMLSMFSAYGSIKRKLKKH